MNHETPSPELFSEIKNAAKTIWNTYDNTYGYASEKIATIEALTNLADNVMICYRMFDFHNQNKMRAILSDRALQYIDANY